MVASAFDDKPPPFQSLVAPMGSGAEGFVYTKIN